MIFALLLVTHILPIATLKVNSDELPQHDPNEECSVCGQINCNDAFCESLRHLQAQTYELRDHDNPLVPLAEPNTICIQDCDECCVCLEKFDDDQHKAIRLPCGHRICKPVLDGLRAQSSQVNCPMCRQTIEIRADCTSTPEELSQPYMFTKWYIFSMIMVHFDC